MMEMTTIRKIADKITLQQVFLALMFAGILLPVFASAATPVNWELPEWQAGNFFSGGEVTNQEGAIAFYQYFHVYLTPIWGALSPAVSIGGRLLQFIVSLPSIFQGIFFGAVKLLGIYTDLGDQQTDLGKLFILMQTLGAIVFGLTSVVYFTYVIFNGKSKEIKKVMETMVLLFLVVGFIPWGLNKVFALSSAAITDTATATTGDIGTTLLQNNVVDKEVLAMNNWNVSVDKDGVIGNPVQYNMIQNIYGWDPGEVLGVINTKSVLEPLDEARKKADGTDQNYIQTVFKNELSTYPNPSANGQKPKETQRVMGIEYHDTITAANFMEDNYLRYKINWLPLIISSVAITMIYAMMTLKIGTSAFVMTLTVVALPVLAAIKAKSPKKVKEEIGHIFSGAYGVFFEFLIVVVAMYMILWLNNGTASQILAGTGLSAVQLALLKCFFYVGLLFGVMSGAQAIERFIGVSTSHQNPLQQMAAAMIVTGGVIKGGGAAMDFGKNLATNTAKEGVGMVKSIGKIGNVLRKGNTSGLDPFEKASNKNNENPFHENGASSMGDKGNFGQEQSQDVPGNEKNQKSSRAEKAQEQKAGSAQAEKPNGTSNETPTGESSRDAHDAVEPENKGATDSSSNEKAGQEQTEESSRRAEAQKQAAGKRQNAGHTPEAPIQGQSVNERLEKMERHQEVQATHQEKSQRAQEAAQKKQQRQIASQQMQMGFQRMQSAANNHMGAPVQDDEEQGE
jgi:hypothetical protein